MHHKAYLNGLKSCITGGANFILGILGMKTNFRVISFLTLLLVGINAAQSAPEAIGIKFWDVADSNSAKQVDHSVWQELLNKYLVSGQSGVNLFKYSEVSKEDTKLLSDYVNSLEELDPRKLNKQEQEAYWINLYNAATVELIVIEKPKGSISEIKESFFSFDFGPWNIKLLKIAGQDVSLNDIEHGVLRPFWQEPRHHFAVNCASMGCPNLQKTVFTAKNMEQMLDKGTREFINHSRGASFDGKTLTLSSIFEWYGVDFGNSEEEVFEYIQEYRLLGKKIPQQSIQGIDYEYDWNLNTP